MRPVALLHNSLGNIQKKWHVLQHTASRAFAGNLLDRATEVDVQYIGVCLIDNNLGSLAYRVHILAIYLNGNGTLIVADLQLLQAFVDHAYQRIAGDKFGIHHSSSHLPAKQTETNIRDILHGCQQNGTFSKINVSYVHDILTAPPRPSPKERENKCSIFGFRILLFE